MRALIHVWIVCAGVACAGVAMAAPKTARPSTPKVDAGTKYREAVKLSDQGEPEKALATIEEGLALAPQDPRLLGLKRTVLLNLHDYTGALAAYQAYVDTGVKGPSLRAALKIIGDLEAVKSTFLDVTLASGSAPIYLDTKTQGVFCTAAPSCTKALLPGD